jgi:hypothetical protein
MPFPKLFITQNNQLSSGNVCALHSGGSRFECRLNIRSRYECGSNPHGLLARRPSQALCAPSLGPSYEGPVLLKKFQLALRLRYLTSSGSKKRDPRYVRVLPRLHTPTAHGLFPVPHFLHKGLSTSPIMCRCLLRVLYALRRPITTLDCALLKDISAVLAAVLGHEINS